MAVSEQTPYKEYTANGSTNSFALEFDCENQDHLIVLVDDVEPVVGTWSLSDGAVVFGTAPINGKKITIQRNTPFRRDGDFQSYDNSFRPGSVNKGFDKIWWKIQELGVADWLLGLKLQKFRDDVNLTALENTLEEAKQIRDETADSVTEVQSNVEQSQTLLENTTTQSNLAQGYAENANTSKDQAQQSVIDASNIKSDMYTALYSFQNGAIKAYPTLALANADIANIALDTKVSVLSLADGGDYYKATANAMTLTKSAYDPLTQAKLDSTEKDATLKDEIISNKTGSWVVTDYTSRFTLTGKRIRKTDGVIEAQAALNIVTDFIEVKKGMTLTLNTVSATPDFPWYALYDSSKALLSIGATTTSHSPHVARTVEINVAQDGYLVAWTNTQYIATYGLQLNAPRDIYVAPSQVKTLEAPVTKPTDTLSLESAKQLVSSSLTKKTYVADYMTKTIIDPVIASFYQETQGATNASVKPALVGGKLTYLGEFLPSASLPFRLILAFFIEYHAAAKTADRRFTVMIKGRAKGTNYTLRKTIPDQHTQIVVSGINADAWTEFDLMLQSDFRGILQGADKIWGLNIAAIDTAVKADVQLEFDHFMLIDTQENFLKSDYLAIVNSKTIYIANQTLPHVSRGNWFGKKMVTLGHSIVYQNKWQDLLAQLIGATYSMAETRGTVTQQPLALGGAWLRAAYSNATLWTFASKPTQSDGYRNSSIYYRADWVAQYNPDLILIFNPTNDSTTPSVVGEITDPIYTGAEVFYTDAGAPTVISSLKGIFKKLGEQNPKARIVFCSDILGGFINGDVDSALSKLSNANLVARHNKIKAVCELYGVQFVDLLHDAWNVYEASSCYNPADMIHPNEIGGEKIARSIAPKL